MDQIKIKYRQLNKKKYEEKFEEIVKNAEELVGSLVFLEKDSEIFLLNNILMSFQFFYNYEREMSTLRENWFKNVPIEKHYKQYFHADSIHRLVASNIKFCSRHGDNKNVEEFLHPLRVFISSNNIKAAFDPSCLDRFRFQVYPHYMFTVKFCENEKKEKAGYVNVMEYKIVDPDSNNSSPPVSASPVNENLQYDFLRRSDHFEKKTAILQRKSTIDLKVRRLTKTEKLIAFQNKDVKQIKNENNDKRSSLMPTFEGKIPINCFYKYVKSSQRITPKNIMEFKMNNLKQLPYILPKKCFQVVPVKQQLENGKRAAFNKNQLNDYITTKNVLNSAAFLGNFCDTLIEKLAETVNLDYYALNDSFLHEEFVIINQRGLITCMTPVVEILDWSNFIKICEEKAKHHAVDSVISWPTAQMKGVLHNLPCYLVPKGYWVHMEENEEYEKEWKIEFVKGEEYLLLHMMHAQVRCFLFVVALYKSFIEKEINTSSFNSKHILHHLFWKVHENFLNWPEDKPGETLLRFLRSLYKKIQNKSLPHFFIKSRNLFESSHPKDLHKVQTIIKMILDEPVPFVMKAIKNLKLKQEFYNSLNLDKLNIILKSFYKPIKEPKKKKELEKEKKTVTFEDDKELLWRKQIIKQIQKEKKIEEQDKPKLSIESIDIQNAPQLKFNTPSGQQLIELFIFHFVEMGLKSIEHGVLNQAFTYLFQIQKLLEFFPVEKFEQAKLHNLNKNLSKLQEECNKLKKKFNYTDMDSENWQKSITKLHKDEDNIEIINSCDTKEINIMRTEKNIDERNKKVEYEKQEEIFSTKL